MWADSFDYSNKYAIIEYLCEIAESGTQIDLLLLTHNFDFYRTVSSRVNPVGKLSTYIAYKDKGMQIKMEPFRYRKDYFEKGILSNIRNGKIVKAQKLYQLLACIPFCRNLLLYMKEGNYDEFLTSLVHLKPSTLTISISDLWAYLAQYFDLPELQCDKWAQSKVIDVLFSAAQNIPLKQSSHMEIEDKIVMSMAIRIKAEMFLERRLSALQCNLQCSSNQTREWTRLARDMNALTSQEEEIIGRVCIVTPENIHLNSFMYEPIIDMPFWTLKELYDDCERLMA